MSNELQLLRLCRGSVDETLKRWDRAPKESGGQWNTRFLTYNWPELQGQICGWWAAYKKWEAADTFDEAFQDGRMTVRTFGADFDYQKSKTFAKGTIDVADRLIFADGQYTAPTESQKNFHYARYNWPTGVEKEKYWARRGIDSSPFANPANFASREKKYEEGLHDLSASLLNPHLPIFEQIHNSEQGAHFSFLPISKEGDQTLIFDLTRHAKDLRNQLPQLYLLTRNCRAEMTRLKVAQELDMGTGYVLVPASKPGGGPQYKLRYGLKDRMTVPGRATGVPVTRQIYAARQKAAREFKSILGKREGKNEIIIAIRKHAGPFPLFAIRDGEELACYQIVNSAMVRTGNMISAQGHITSASMRGARETGTFGLPIRPPATILPYAVANSSSAPVLQAASPQRGAGPPPPRVPPPLLRGGGTQPFTPWQADITFRSRLVEAVEGLGEIPKRSGLRVFVVGPKYDLDFQRIYADVENQVRDLNTKGYRLSMASLPNRAELAKAEVRLYYV